MNEDGKNEDQPPHPSPSTPRAPGAAFERLVGVMDQLRGPSGCPWDLEQTLATLRRWLVEETYELLDAIDADDIDAHREELGDLLLQVVFQARIRSEQGAFDVAAVCDGIADKMVRRHPHVFGDATAEDADAVRVAWSALKRKEGRQSALDGLPRGMPALARALRVGEKAADAGFDWRDPRGVLDKIDEEHAELRQAMQGGDPASIAHELGDYLFTLVNLCRHLGVDPEAALQGTNRRFERRFRVLEAGVHAEGVERIGDLGEEELERRWQAAKRATDAPHKATSGGAGVEGPGGRAASGSGSGSDPE